MNKKLKIIQVGTGGWGWSWISVIKNSDDWELAGIVDLDKELLNKACSFFNIDKNIAFTDVKEAINSIEADAGLVVVPPQHHCKVAVDLLEGGLNCIIEKPLASTIKESKIIIDTAEKHNKKLMVSQNYRFKKAPQTVKKVIEDNTIGEVGTVYINFQKAPPFDGFRTKMDEPLIQDMAVHHFDQIRGILSLEPVKVIAHSWNPRWSWFDGNAAASVIFETSNGSNVSYVGSWVSRGWETTWDGDWHIQGDEGEIRWHNNKVIVNPTDVFKSVFMPGAFECDGKLNYNLLDIKYEERQGTLHEFAESIRNDKEPQTSGKDNIKSFAMVLAAKISAETNKSVYIEDVLNGKYE